MSEFAVRGLDPAAFNIIGGWRSAESSEIVSFSGSAMPDDVLVWSVDLPTGSRQANALLAEQEAELAASRLQVATAGAQMRALTPAMARSGPVSFGAAETSPEEELMATLAALRGQDPDEVSFGLRLPGLPADWRAMVDEYLAFSRQMINLLKPTLRVETRSGAELLAVSQFKLDGDAAHNWPVQFAADQTWQHGRTVRLTLQTRLALMQLFAQVSTGAIALAPRFLGGAGTAILALPATYKYIKSTVAQFKKLRTLEKQLGAVQTG